jgi:hypothetical protein
LDRLRRFTTRAEQVGSFLDRVLRYNAWVVDIEGFRICGSQVLRPMETWNVVSFVLLLGLDKLYLRSVAWFHQPIRASAQLRALRRPPVQKCGNK